MNAAEFVAALEESRYRYFGLRVVWGSQERNIGDILPNSWHNASDCDWVAADTELDGTCCFEIQGGEAENLGSALSYALACWPDAETILLIGSDEIGGGDLPEDGAVLLRNPMVLARITHAVPPHLGSAIDPSK